MSRGLGLHFHEGWHSFEIVDGTDVEKTWSKDFKASRSFWAVFLTRRGTGDWQVLGWFDDYKGWRLGFLS